MKISIITVVYFRECLIAEAMQSVYRQTHGDIEYIIVDGGSRDGTVEKIKRFEEAVLEDERQGFSFRWISEPDRGVYDAMNKGIRMATGEVVAILNSDDFYHRNDTLSRVAEAFAEDPDLQVVYGDNVWVRPDDLKRRIRYVKGSNYNWFTARCGVMPPHATFFVRKENFEKYGYYDDSYKICADFERELFFLEKLKLKSRYLPFDFMTMRTGGISSSGIKGYWTSIKECHRACKEVKVFTCWPMQFLKLAIKSVQLFQGRLKTIVHGAVIFAEISLLLFLLAIPCTSQMKPASRSCLRQPTELRFRFAPGQDALLSKMYMYRLYYQTRDARTYDEQRSIRLKSSERDQKGFYRFLLPRDVCAFRLDGCLKTVDIESKSMPTFASVMLGDEHVEGKVECTTDPNHTFVSVHYRRNAILNGYLLEYFFLLGVVLAGVIFGFFICKRRSVYREPWALTKNLTT